ncbi:hypothetical protein Bbelb_031060 [Branchiostoma belcheri]|nr:hypothetical protein Bbelb_031060 [Branchiostoma belcheri]
MNIGPVSDVYHTQEEDRFLLSLRAKAANFALASTHAWLNPAVRCSDQEFAKKTFASSSRVHRKVKMASLVSPGYDPVYTTTKTWRTIMAYARDRTSVSVYTERDEQRRDSRSAPHYRDPI